MADDDIHMKPATLYGLMLLLAAGNLGFMAMQTDGQTEGPTREQVEYLQQQIAELRGQVTTLQQIGPTGIKSQMEKLQSTVDSCMPCHLQAHGKDDAKAR